MALYSNRYYSSSETTLSAKSDKPLTYVQWLQYETSFDRVSAFEQYTKYLAEWYHTKKVDSETYNILYSLIKLACFSIKVL